MFSGGSFKIETSGVQVYLTRFLCAFLLHMELSKEFREGILLMRYLIIHSDDFTGTTGPFICCFL
jgi:hypothetical protein